MERKNAMTKKQKTVLAVILSAIIIGGAAGVYFFSNQTEPAAIVQEPISPVEEKPEVNPTPEIEETPEVEKAVESEISQTPEIPQEYPLQEELADEPVEEVQEDGTATLQEQPPIQEPVQETEPAPVPEQNDLPEGGKPGQTYVPGFGWVTPGENGGVDKDYSEHELSGNKVGNMG